MTIQNFIACICVYVYKCVYKCVHTPMNVNSTCVMSEDKLWDLVLPTQYVDLKNQTQLVLLTESTYA